MTKKRVHLIYGILLSAAAITAGICLIAACVGIYRSGAHPFTRESVAAAFRSIAVPVYICLALVIGGFVLDIFYPAEKKKQKVEKQYDVILQKLRAKLDVGLCDPALRTAMEAEQKARNVRGWITLGLLAVCSAVFLCYGLNINHFTKEDMNGSMIGAMKLFIPCLAIPFGYAVFTAYRNRCSIRKEIELAKKAIAAGSQVPAPAEITVQGNITYLTYGILAISLVLLIFGLFTNGYADVWGKAAAICTECIGLG